MVGPAANTEVFAAERQVEAGVHICLAELSRFFSVDFAIWNGETGSLLRPVSGVPSGDELAVGELVRAVTRQRKPQFIGDADEIVILATPVPRNGNWWVATAAFVTRSVADDDPLDDAARLLDCSPQEVRSWARTQQVWNPTALLRLAEAVLEKRVAEGQVAKMHDEVELVSRNLASTYEEISLLYAVTQNLRISSTDEQLGHQATEWLGECIPAKGCAVQYLASDGEGDGTYKARKRSLLISHGECPIDDEQLTELVEYLELTPAGGPYIANRRITEGSDWPFPAVRQLIIAPLSEGEHLFGWLAVVNHVRDDEFGTVEAQLLNSVGALLGIHSSNRELYRQQSDFLANVVRALVSAIDAKDPYTSGHSDRVARFAVRIALEMRCGPKLINTIYMAGLLHDVGKIGIDDHVLRKAGRLTPEEFEHIKQHPEMGYRILADLKQLSDVLPAVLHHHEQWNGKGYPYGLKEKETPLLARIMAVADAYDAMTSDRPYRAGMPEETVDRIFREGSGQHWDPEIVEAFFRAKDDIKSIAHRERTQVGSPANEQWI